MVELSLTRYLFDHFERFWRNFRAHPLPLKHPFFCRKTFDVQLGNDSLHSLVYHFTHKRNRIAFPIDESLLDLGEYVRRVLTILAERKGYSPSLPMITPFPSSSVEMTKGLTQERPHRENPFFEVFRGPYGFHDAVELPDRLHIVAKYYSHFLLIEVNEESCILREVLSRLGIILVEGQYYS